MLALNLKSYYQASCRNWITDLIVSSCVLVVSKARAGCLDGLHKYLWIYTNRNKQFIVGNTIIKKYNEHLE